MLNKYELDNLSNHLNKLLSNLKKRSEYSFEFSIYECDFEVKQIDGDYAHLQRIDRPEEELKLVARALLPIEIYEGCILHYEMMQYSIID